MFCSRIFADFVYLLRDPMNSVINNMLSNGISNCCQFDQPISVLGLFGGILHSSKHWRP